jgi:hypothetical protein
MILGPDTTLAHYRITAALGAGGMGEVWRVDGAQNGNEITLASLPDDFEMAPTDSNFCRIPYVLSRSTKPQQSIALGAFE